MTWLVVVAAVEEEEGGIIQMGMGMGMDDKVGQIPSSSQMVMIVTTIIRIVKMRIMMGFVLVRIGVLHVSVGMIRVIHGDVWVSVLLPDGWLVCVADLLLLRVIANSHDPTFFLSLEQ